MTPLCKTKTMTSNTNKTQTKLVYRLSSCCKLAKGEDLILFFLKLSSEGADFETVLTCIHIIIRRAQN